MKKESKYVNLGLDLIRSVSPEVADLVVEELDSQRSNLKMIASENYCSLPVQAAMGTLFTDKYAEGYPNHRFYAGCETVDKLESLGCETACKLFGTDHANIQPHCGADANMQAYWAVLNAKVLTPEFEEIKKDLPDVKTYSDLTDAQWETIRKACHNQKLLGMDYYSGGHLTHGYRQNISAQLFKTYSYGVGEDGLIDYDALEKQACKVKPLILLAGFSAYPRAINFRRFREIADKCGAVLMVDMAHFAGLIAGKVYKDKDLDPVKWADIVTTTTHKTLRGPRGGMILCKKWLAESVDKGCPLTMGGPLPHVMAAKTIALIEASSDEFMDYAKQIVRNSQALAKALMSTGIELQTNGTDNHIVLMNVTKFGLTGRQAEQALRDCGITCNRNALPNDPNGPWYTSGIRLGTAALTTLGMTEGDMTSIGYLIYNILKNCKATGKSKVAVDLSMQKKAREEVALLLTKYKLYPEVKIKV